MPIRTVGVRLVGAETNDILMRLSFRCEARNTDFGVPLIRTGLSWRCWYKAAVTSKRHLQRFVTIHDAIANLFHVPRHAISSSHHRELRAAAMTMWVQVVRA